MGQELNCTVRYQGKSAKGRALLETSEILFRGDFRLKIPLSSITSVRAVDGELHLKTKEGLAVFELGAKAANWCERIVHPKSLIEKLGVKAGETISVIGRFAPEFVASLRKTGAKVAIGRNSSTAKWIFMAIASREELPDVIKAGADVQSGAALWVVYPKGQKTITEGDVREAGLKAGLVDVKVASFSATHTALKFVVPKAKR